MIISVQVIGREVFHRASEVELLPSCRMLMLQRYESVIFGGKHDQTAPAILFQILIHLQLQEAKKKNPPFNAFPICISAVASKRISTTQTAMFFVHAVLFHQAWTKSLKPILKLLELRMGGISFLHNSQKLSICFYLSDSKRNGFDASLDHI